MQVVTKEEKCYLEEAGHCSWVRVRVRDVAVELFSCLCIYQYWPKCLSSRYLQ